METKETTFVDLEKVLHKLKSDVYDAVTPIIDKVQIPIQVDMYSIDIPVLQTSNIGERTKGLITSRPQINIMLNI